MKSNFFSIRNIVSVLAISGMMISSTTASYARSNKKETAIPVLSTSIAPSVECLESSVEGQLFKIGFEAPQTTKVELVVTDEKGEVLYSKIFETASFSKYVKLVNEGFEAPSKIYFTFREMPNGSKHVFAVRNEQTLVQDVVITKL